MLRTVTNMYKLQTNLHAKNEEVHVQIEKSIREIVNIKVMLSNQQSSVPSFPT